MSIFTELANIELITTENGALMESTSGKKLLDMNFNVASYRSKDGKYLYNLFKEAMKETPREALRWLFYLRDCRGGMGERETFRKILVPLLEECKELQAVFLELVPEYGYWKDLCVIYEMTKDAKMKQAISDIFVTQIIEDIRNSLHDKSISLAGKYMPTDTTKRTGFRQLANHIQHDLGINTKQYRKIARSLRGYLDVVEKKMSRNEWEAIKYETVPSRANRIYAEAFKRNDEDRYTDFIKEVNAGKKTMKSSVNTPHEILRMMRRDGGWSDERYVPDDTAEALWKNLPHDDIKRVLIVEDRSGSMTSAVPGMNNTSAMLIADALTLFFAENLDGAYHNSFITFSKEPRVWKLKGNSLYDRTISLTRYSEISNTDIEKVFDLVLNTAITNQYTQDDMPESILVLSDMEFDEAQADGYRRRCYGFRQPTRRVNMTLMEEIQQKWKKAGYKLPRLIFWNLCGRTGGVPITENEAGVSLISGFSPVILKGVLEGELDAWENLKGIVNGKRYEDVDKAIKRVIKNLK